MLIDLILDDIDEKIVDELTLFFNPNKYAIAAPIISINWFEPSSEASPYIFTLINNNITRTIIGKSESNNDNNLESEPNELLFLINHC